MKKTAARDEVDFEDRKLLYINRSANIRSDEDRKAIEREFADVIARMIEGTKAANPSPKKSATVEGPANAAEAAISFGAMAVAMAGLEAATNEELAELIGASGTLLMKRNPDASTAELVAMLGLDVKQAEEPKAADVTLKNAEGEEYFLAEEPGAYEQPTDGGIVKFAAGDRLFMNAEGSMRVEAYITEDALSLKWQAQAKLAKELGAPDGARSKEAVAAYLSAKLKEREEIIAAIPDPDQTEA